MAPGQVPQLNMHGKPYYQGEEELCLEQNCHNLDYVAHDIRVCLTPKCLISHNIWLHNPGCKA